ncbi:MAG: tyramine oxidase, partial [Pseudonocardiales bacterium]|nr:tyramine oxidase [Pseudonocardiales bacterium]
MTAVLVTHPLEPLSGDEIAAATAILREGRGLTPTHRFVFVSLHEPTKAALAAGPTPPREAHVVLYERGTRATYEAVVSLTAGTVESW